MGAQDFASPCGGNSGDIPQQSAELEVEVEVAKVALENALIVEDSQIPLSELQLPGDTVADTVMVVDDMAEEMPSDSLAPGCQRTPLAPMFCPPTPPAPPPTNSEPAQE
jgi:hypothetical protein